MYMLIMALFYNASRTRQAADYGKFHLGNSFYLKIHLVQILVTNFNSKYVFLITF